MCMSVTLLVLIALFVKNHFTLRIQILSLLILHFITAHFAFITAQIGYHCTLKVAIHQRPESGAFKMKGTNGHAPIVMVKKDIATF